MRDARLALTIAFLVTMAYLAGVLSVTSFEYAPIPTPTPTAGATATFAVAVETRAAELRLDDIGTVQARWFAHETALWEGK